MADLTALFSVRRAKRRALIGAGVDPYPEKGVSRTPIQTLLKSFDSLVGAQKTIRIAGRVIGIRAHGGATFFDLRDANGVLQALFSREQLGERNYKLVSALDIGDFLWVAGRAMRTKRGEATVSVTRVRLLTKAMRPIPTQWYGLRDVEERFRAREIDLLFNPSVAERFRVRSRLTQALRNELERRGFWEVETPILQPRAGGANARPFRTRLHALDMSLYLRVAPELYLKRLLVGGFEKVFELGRSFRNEGVDQTHNPEFTMLEFYWAYQDMEGLARFTETLLGVAVKKSVGRNRVPFRGNTIDFAPHFQRVAFFDVFRARIGVDLHVASRKDLEGAARQHTVPAGKEISDAKLIDHLFKKVIAHTLVQPTFVVNHPLALSPLAKALPQNHSQAARFQLYAGGLELVNAYSELNDPVEQRKRFHEEFQRARAGDREAQRGDDAFLTALEYGMPPAAGFGLGVDRLVMLLTDAPSLREVIFFPTMRQKKRSPQT